MTHRMNNPQFRGSRYTLGPKISFPNITSQLNSAQWILAKNLTNSIDEKFRPPNNLPSRQNFTLLWYYHWIWIRLNFSLFCLDIHQIKVILLNNTDRLKIFIIKEKIMITPIWRPFFSSLANFLPLQLWRNSAIWTDAKFRPAVTF